jgi:hypothetical protein
MPSLFPGSATPNAGRLAHPAFGGPHPRLRLGLSMEKHDSMNDPDLDRRATPCQQDGKARRTQREVDHELYGLGDRVVDEPDLESGA